MLDYYSPVRHLASAVFPFSDQHKHMLMLSAYMDETGHSADERQKYVGIAGVLAPAANWERFEGSWKTALKLPYIDLPYFHMKDFANSKKEYAGWSESKRRKVLGKLLTVIEVAHPLPIGCIVPMEHYRTLKEEYRNHFIDPYYLCFQGIISACSSLLESTKAPADERVALVFSDQVEFRHKALRLYELVQQTTLYEKRVATPPDFRKMQELVPLQAADIIAYEMYKEYERTTERPHMEPRFGYQRMVKMAERQGFPRPAFFVYDKGELDEQIEVIEKFRDMQGDPHSREGVQQIEKKIYEHYAQKNGKRLELYEKET